MTLKIKQTKAIIVEKNYKIVRIVYVMTMRNALRQVFSLYTIALFLGLFTSTSLHGQSREVINLDTEWQFALGDHPDAKNPKFDTSQWRTLNVPHDWAFEADYAKDAAQKDRGGYKPGGIGWYSKSFEYSDAWNGKQVSIEFDGVYMNSEVWINGEYLGKRPYGYIPFHYDLTKHLKPGSNKIVVRADNKLEPSARWYHGCGIYAHVNMVVSDLIRIPKDGVYVRTPVVSKSAATVNIDTEVKNSAPKAVNLTITTSIIDAAGKTLKELKATVTLKAGEEKTVPQKINLTNPALWDVENPTLYTVKSTLSTGDEVETAFGIRKVEWKADTGFWLNGKNIKLLGVAEHLEGGPVGAAYSDELIRWKIQKFKNMGCNAIRVAHNPQVPEFYKACNEMGMLVMDEVFDGWMKKANQDYGKQAFKEWWEKDLRTWLKANRNHPSVIIWSLGNETRGDIAKDLVAVCHELDPTRLTTSGHAGSEHMDVYGVNGHSEEPQFFKKHKSDKPFVATEAPHTWQVRGYYRSKTWYRNGPRTPAKAFPLPDLTKKEIFTYDWTSPAGRENGKQVFNSSYDNAMVRISARKNWELMRDLPWYSGHFRWTGFDYLGEAGYVHGGWPFRAFMGGALDLAGFEKDLFYFYQSQWTTKPMAHILPHWTHPKMKAGTLVPVWVYSNCDEVELFLNGKSLGKDKPGTAWDEMQCEWMVPWEAGELVAVASNKGVKAAEAKQTTAGVPAQLGLSIEGNQNPILTIQQQDKNGVLNPYGENRIHYHIDGAARIISLESGNPVNTENNYGKTSRTAFFGLASCFLELESSSDGDVSIISAAILGEKQLMTSNTVSIDVKSLDIRGTAGQKDFNILYSTDGSEPSLPYEQPFEVSANTTVKASVSRGGKVLLNMAESFGPKEGIYWGNEKDANGHNKNLAGDQAEGATFKGVQVMKQQKGFQGTGYLDFKDNKSAYVEWYQENDGSAGKYHLKIRYSTSAKASKMQLTVNGKSELISLPAAKKRKSSWLTVKLSIMLRGGANTIRLTNTEQANVSIDEIIVQ